MDVTPRLLEELKCAIAKTFVEGYKFNHFCEPCLAPILLEAVEAGAGVYAISNALITVIYVHDLYALVDYCKQLLGEEHADALDVFLVTLLSSWERPCGPLQMAKRRK